MVPGAVCQHRGEGPIVCRARRRRSSRLAATANTIDRVGLLLPLEAGVFDDRQVDDVEGPLGVALFVIENVQAIGTLA